MKKVAVMNDLSGFGKCSLTAAIPVLSALGVQCCPLPSAVLTNQTGYPHYHFTDLSDMLTDYIDAWEKNGAHFDGIYSGFMMSSEQINSFIGFLEHFYENDTFLLVDPVMGDDGRMYSIYSPQLLESTRTLSRKADLITPNLTEACLLAGYDLEKVYQNATKENLFSVAIDMGTKLRESAEKNQDVVITGIKCKDDASPFIYNLAITSEGIFENKSHFFNKSFSGTGDLFASVMCGCHLNGISTFESMKLASSFLYHSIADTMNDDISPSDGVNFEKFLIELIKGGTSYGK